jgi:hypothetical protein
LKLERQKNPRRQPPREGHPLPAKITPHTYNINIEVQALRLNELSRKIFRPTPTPMVAVDR